MEPVKVVICAGTTCYVMGSSHLLTLADYLDPAELERVKITGARCLGYCEDGRHSNAPYVLIDDEVLSEATLPTLLSALRERLSQIEEEA